MITVNIGIVSRDTSQNGDTSKTATRLNSDNPTYPKRFVDLKNCIQNGACRRFGLSPFCFWRVAVLDTSKQRLGEKSSWICCHFGVSPFWFFLRFGFVAVLETTKSATHVPKRGGMSPFWKCRHFGCVAVLTGTHVKASVISSLGLGSNQNFCEAHLHT